MSVSSPSAGSWALAALLRPVLFALAIVAAVLTGDRTGSFWLGLLAFFVAAGVGRAVRRLLRARYRDTLRALLWPAGASGFAVLFSWLDLPTVVVFLLAAIGGAVVRSSVGDAFLPKRRSWSLRGEDVQAVADVIAGDWRRKPT